jgi:tyrosinase
MWAAWKTVSTHANPASNAWLNGPPSNGERKFAMPLPGNTEWDYKPKDVGNLGQLDYTYDDLQAPAPSPNPLTGRLVRLGVPEHEAATAAEEVPMITGKQIELLGASPTALKLQANGARTAVKLDSNVRSKVSASLTGAHATKKPDRVFLELENVRGQGDAELLNVYVNVPAGASPGDHPELLAGTAGLFGVSKASEPDSQHGGQGLNFVMDITKIIDQLHLDNALDADSLDVSIVPYQSLDESADITVGRVNVYRKGD